MKEQEKQKGVFGIYSLTSKCNKYIYFGIVEFDPYYPDSNTIYDYRLLNAIILEPEAQIIANASLYESSDIFGYTGRSMLGVGVDIDECWGVVQNIVEFHRNRGEKIVLNPTAYNEIRISKHEEIPPLTKRNI